MVDLSTLEGFEEVQSTADLAKFASRVPNAVGFTAHPLFESIDKLRYAHAVVWYTRLSPPQESWRLYLFEESEAKKKPGETPKASAVATAEVEVSGKLNAARELIEEGGTTGVRLSGDFNEKKTLALAVIRLGGSFQHSGGFGSAHCRSCRSVIPGGDPSHCGFGIRNQPHWTCCGAPKEVEHCLYWLLIKAQDEAEQGAAEQPATAGEPK